MRESGLAQKSGLAQVSGVAQKVGPKVGLTALKITRDNKGEKVEVGSMVFRPDKPKKDKVEKKKKKKKKKKDEE